MKIKVRFITEQEYDLTQIERADGSITTDQQEQIDLAVQSLADQLGIDSTDFDTEVLIVG